MTHRSQNPRGRTALAAGWSLYTAQGQRKYLNRDERARFLQAADFEDQPVRALCLTLAYTGCRLSEALSLRVSSVQPVEHVIAVRTLKQRGRLLVREIPVPECVIDALISADMQDHPEMRLFPFGRTYAWQQVKRVMARAGVIGSHASPRGLRHGFGVAAILAGVPITLVQKWLGHANIATTAIYTNAVGPDEREIAKRMWTPAQPNDPPVAE